MIQLAWRFLRLQADSALAQWYQACTAGGRGATRKTMIVALARKLLIAPWRRVTTGEVPEGVGLRPAAGRWADGPGRVSARGPQADSGEPRITIRVGSNPRCHIVLNRNVELVRRGSASPPMRMIALWFGTAEI